MSSSSSLTSNHFPVPFVFMSTVSLTGWQSGAGRTGQLLLARCVSLNFRRQSGISPNKPTGLLPQVRSSLQPRRTSSEPTFQAFSCSLWLTRSRPNKSKLFTMTVTRVRPTDGPFIEHAFGIFVIPPPHPPAVTHPLTFALRLLRRCRGIQRRPRRR